MEYQDGGHVWISIPRLDMYDYHPLSITSTNVNPEWRGTMLLQCKVYDKWTQVCCSHELVPEPVTMLGKAIADLERTLFQLRTWSAI
ncbi:MAG: hypothetical protein HC767_10990 [Akkermansiaceae bacterium]|nr:hypothetical protein [Akkermansiaceae bacterium]